MTKYLKILADKFGYQLRKKSQIFGDLETEASEALQIIRPYTMLNRERLVILFNQVGHCERSDMPGCYVECGVWKGGSVGLMALANMKYGSRRRHIHLFDSFEDICEPDADVDGARAVREVKKWSKGGATGKLQPLHGFYDAFGGPGSLEGNRALLERTIGYDRDYLHYHKGWFQDTLPADAPAIGEIALLRLDGDWYASTKVCLEHLYDKVVKGGFVVVDDYGAYEGCRKAVDEFMQSRSIKAYLHHVDMECKYWIKPD